MAPRAVTGARMIGRAYVSTETAVFCAPQSPRPPAARAASSGAVLAAAASAGWCEAGASALGSRAAETRGAQVTCGLWLARRRLVVAVLGREGPRRVIRAALTDDARFGLIEYLTAVGAELVSTEALTRVDLTPVQAVRRGLSVWTAGDALVAALLGAAAIRDPVRAAALLARLPAIPLLRSSIRRLAGPDRRQLPLL